LQWAATKVPSAGITSSLAGAFFRLLNANIRIRLGLTRRGSDAPAPESIKKGVDTMRRQITALVSCAFVAASGAALAHHSFAMFDQENPIELEGVVQEFKFTSPHTFIILQVRQPDGSTQLWSLEGGAPSALARDGWSSKSLKPGDALQMTIEPLRSGAPGGSWTVGKTKFKDGRPIMVTP
jgi:hypothetical protein